MIVSCKPFPQKLETVCVGGLVGLNIFQGAMEHEYEYSVYV